MCTPSAERLDCGRHGGENEFLRKDAGESLLSGRFNMQLCNHETVALIRDGADQEGGWGVQGEGLVPFFASLSSREIWSSCGETSSHAP